MTSVAILATDDMKRMLSELNEAELHGNATESTRSMFVTAAAKQQLEISSCLQEVFHVSMWQFVIVRFAFSRAINCPRLRGEYRLCDDRQVVLPSRRHWN